VINRATARDLELGYAELCVHFSLSFILVVRLVRSTTQADLLSAAINKVAEKMITLHDEIRIVNIKRINGLTYLTD